MKRLQAILYFQRRLFLLSIVVSVLIGSILMNVAESNIIQSSLASYFFISSLFHYFTYDVINRNEYDFYANFGLSKLALWGSTIAIGLLCLIISSLL